MVGRAHRVGLDRHDPEPDVPVAVEHHVDLADYLLAVSRELFGTPPVEQVGLGAAGDVEQTAPLRGWDLPEVFSTLRRLLEGRMGKAGKREYVQFLRLMESFPLHEVEAAIHDALRLGAIGFDAVKHLVLCRIDRRPPRLNLEVYPYLPRARVATTLASSYMSLLSASAP